jgi:CheY-like chemotaxis protein
MGAARVLIVDDEPAILASTALLLKDLGFEARTWRYPEGIVEEMLRDPPDLLLQDVRMPGLDVEKLAERMRSEPRLRAVRLLLFTASMEGEAVRDRVRAHGLLDKPFKPEDLRRAIEAALA